MNYIDETLKERGKQYGDFVGHAEITQRLKRAMERSPKWNCISDDKREALDMIVHKIARILNGDPEFHDSWHDIVGYAKLVADSLSPPTPKSEGSEGFKLGDYVKKKSGSEWQGYIVGTYSTELTPYGYAVESSTHLGSVQIYPSTALELI